MVTVTVTVTGMATQTARKIISHFYKGKGFNTDKFTERLLKIGSLQALPRLRWQGRNFDLRYENGSLCNSCAYDQIV